MFTDAPPRTKGRDEFLKSDRITKLDLSPAGGLLVRAQHIESALAQGKTAGVRVACAEFLAEASRLYRVRPCGIRVLAARPLRVHEHSSTELFGDYNPTTMLIRVWMRTAVRKEVTSFGTFLSTLCHEFVHHLDFQWFGFSDSWHTRGFYERAAALYHDARGTPIKKLIWAPLSHGRWRIDWPRTNRGVPTRRAIADGA